MNKNHRLTTAQPKITSALPMNISAHPAVKLGAWLKSARQSRGIVKRLFAEQAQLTPAQYSELEAGIVRWMGEPQLRAIIAALDLSSQELKLLKRMVTEARSAAVKLSFSTLFTREELEPIRCRHSDDSNVEPGEFEKEVILNAVFAELA